ncbi:MAG: protein O-GlcNAc transferase, partial [Humisphaera sp.]|nr:protein O-GlcNAc transferase [Humisphaera sp.]
VAPLPLERNGHVTFGSFNRTMKITAEAIAAWSQILVQVPGSRLVMKGVGMDEPETREHWRAQFRAHGVNGDRIDLVTLAPKFEDHLAAMSAVDIALDTFPYNGTTTTCETLWMGVPVVTLTGDTHVARMGLSILDSIGLSDLAQATTTTAYVETAVKLAGDVERLRELRARLREMISSSPLADAARLARQIESAYRMLWREWCADRR